MSKKISILCVALVAVMAFAAGCSCDNGTNPNPSASPNTSPSSAPNYSGSPSPSPEKSGDPATTTVPQNPDSPVSFTPGKYTATAKGMNGDVVVEVTFTETAIREIQVVSHKETDGIWEKPVDTIPKAIVDTQSLDVDAVAGATMTSNAILNAVEDCVTQAGGDPAALKKGSNTPSGSPSAMPSVSPSATNGNGTNGATTSPSANP